MLDVWPSGFADRGHVEAVPGAHHLLFWSTEASSRDDGIFDTFIGTAAAVLLLLRFDERSKGEFGEAAAHSFDLRAGFLEIQEGSVWIRSHRTKIKITHSAGFRQPLICLINIEPAPFGLEALQ